MQVTLIGQRARTELVNQSCKERETRRRGVSSEKLLEGEKQEKQPSGGGIKRHDSPLQKQGTA